MAKGAADVGRLGSAIEAKEQPDLVHHEYSVVLDVLEAVVLPLAAAQRLQGKAPQDFLGPLWIVGRNNKAPMAASHQKGEQKVFVLGPGRAANQNRLMVCKGMPVGQGAFSPCDARGGRVKAPVAQ